MGGKGSNLARPRGTTTPANWVESVSFHVLLSLYDATGNGKVNQVQTSFKMEGISPHARWKVCNSVCHLVTKAARSLLSSCTLLFVPSCTLLFVPPSRLAPSWPLVSAVEEASRTHTSCNQIHNTL
jgi:hypothetical protein